ncbi:hypothetical protein [Clostridium cylindrosporum]|uniref:Uncharacterized protein n=1 Tax=Clostridium cylindrosporum DSM 605 TaxID=1121307 RepID=A0A0J8DFV0_CLOCY|nr:hypothetical protein [Clostridium cylindrosporum]KMT23038.1 hypothetical protein CLCY_7c00850 [Clostridium cylindrosporum DSM 605]
MAFDENDINDLCDLDGMSICNSCGKCIEFEDNDYMEIKIEGIIKDQVDSYREYEDFEVFQRENDEEDDMPYDFIEDHEEIRDQYYKDLEDILNINE